MDWLLEEKTRFSNHWSCWYEIFQFSFKSELSNSHFLIKNKLGLIFLDIWLFFRFKKLSFSVVIMVKFTNGQKSLEIGQCIPIRWEEVFILSLFFSKTQFQTKKTLFFCSFRSKEHDNFIKRIHFGMQWERNVFCLQSWEEGLWRISWFLCLCRNGWDLATNTCVEQVWPDWSFDRFQPNVKFWKMSVKKILKISWSFWFFFVEILDFINCISCEFWNLKQEKKKIERTSLPSFVLLKHSLNIILIVGTFWKEY